MQQRVHEEQERSLVLEVQEREYVLVLEAMDRRKQEMQRDLAREQALGEREEVLLAEMSRLRRALEELGTRVAEVERRVEVLEGVVRKREERRREERKQAEEEEEEEERGRREEGVIGQMMLRNMKMLALAWSISAIPAFISSSPPSTSS